MGSFNSFSLSSKTRTPLAVPYNRLTRSVSWFFVWQLGREQLCEEASLWCQSTSLSNFRWQSHYYTLSASARKVDRNLKFQTASATWEQESSLSAAPCQGLSPLELCQCLDPEPAFPESLVLRNWLIVTSEGPHRAHPKLLWCLHHCSLPAVSLWEKNKNLHPTFRDVERCPAQTASLPSASPSLTANSCTNALPSNTSNNVSLQKPSSLLMSGYFLLAPSFKGIRKKKHLCVHFAWTQRQRLVAEAL